MHLQIQSFRSTFIEANKSKVIDSGLQVGEQGGQHSIEKLRGISYGAFPCDETADVDTHVEA